MNETTGRVMKDSVKPPHDGTIGPAVAIGSGVYDFPGWSGVVDGNGNFTGAPSRPPTASSRCPTPATSSSR